MIGNAPQSPITGVPGWETQAEQELLTKYAALAPEGSVIAEIGGEFGMSASLFARAAHPSVQIFTVDLFPGDLLDKYVSNLAEAGFAGRTEPIRDNSHVLANARTQSLVDNGYWLLFVDGDHSYEGVAADINGWANSVLEGGYLIFHDVAQATNKMPHLLHFEVTRAISAWLNGQSDFEAVEQVDTTAVFRRVKKTSSDSKNKEYKKGFDYPVDNGLVTYATDAEPLPVEVADRDVPAAVEAPDGAQESPKPVSKSKSKK